VTEGDYPIKLESQNQQIFADEEDDGIVKYLHTDPFDNHIHI
jgi:hypothetical protein